MKKWLLFVFSIGLSWGAKSQCNINVSSSPVSPLCGGCVTLSAFGGGTGNIAFSENFNSGSPTGWAFTQTADYSNPCGTVGADNTPYMWMGSASGNPRDVTTVGLDVSLGGTVCFDMRYSIQGDPSPCEGPDLPDEGVFLQYSVDGGATWVTINYADPNGGNDPQLTTWNNYCFALPPGAITTSTQIRWHQNAVSGTQFDHWGIDNVAIILNDPTYQITWLHDGYAYGLGNPGGTNPNTVCLTNDSTFTAQVTNGTNTCTATVAVSVTIPNLQVAAGTDTSICAGQCVNLNGSTTKVIVSPASTPTFQDNQFSVVTGGTASVDVNVTGLNTTSLTSSSITQVCVNSFTFSGNQVCTSFGGCNCNGSTISLGSTCSLDISSFDLSLTSPGGCQITLVPNGIATGGSYTNVCFVPAGPSINSGGFPTAGQWGPNQPFNGLNGCNPNGVWTLKFNAPGGLGFGVGTLTGWSISFDDPEISYVPPFSWSPTTNMTNSATLNPNVCPTNNSSYTITASDTAGCVTKSSTVNITVLPVCCSLVLDSVVPVNASCGLSNGSFQVFAVGNQGVMTYSSDNGVTFQSSAIFTGMAPGTYTVVVKDNGCSKTQTVTIIDQPAPTISSITPTQPTCGNADGVIIITATGGTAPLTYSIDGGTTTQPTSTFTGLAGGTYNIVVTDALGCQVTSTTTLTAPSPPIITSTTLVDPTCGNTNGSITIIASGGTGILNYSIDNGVTSQAGNGVFTALLDGTYNIVVTDASGCSVTSQVILNPSISFSFASITLVDPSCGASDGTINVQLSGGSAPYTYSIDNGTTTQPGTLFSALGAASYPVHIQDANGCTLDSTVSLSNLGAPVINSSVGTTVSCIINNGQIAITASGGTGTLTYSIDNGTTSQLTSTFTGLATGTYNIVVADASGCQATNQVVLINTNPPTIDSTTPTQPSCGIANGVINIIASGGTGALTYSIDNGVSSQASNGNFTALTDGTYNLLVTDANGCSTTSVVILNPSTGVSFNSISLSNPSCGSANGSIDMAGLGGTPPYSYSTDNGATTQAGGLFNNLLSNTYNLQIKDANGCTADSTIILNNTGGPVIDSLVVSDAACGLANGSIQAYVTGTPTLNYTLDGAGSTTNPLFTNLNAATYQVAVTDGNGCTTSATAVVANLTGPTVSITDSINVSCFGGNDGQATAAMLGGSGNPTYQWLNGATPIGSAATVTNLTQGTYIIQITDAVGCTASNSVTILEPTDLTSTSTFTNPQCFGDCNGTIAVIPAGGTLPYSYLWNDPAAQSTQMASNLCVGNFTLVLTDGNGCFITDNLSLTTPPQVNASVSTTDVNCFGSNDGTATTTIISGTTPFTYSWSGISQNTVVVSNLAAGNYVTTITDANSCSITRNITISEPTQLNISVTNFSDVSCNGGICDGLIQTVATGGTLPYTYLWSNGANVSDINSLCTNSYVLTVTDANGCTATITQVIATPTPLNPVVTKQNISCNNSCNGTATVNTSGGIQPYSIQWGGGASFQTVVTATGICAGIADVTVTDANNCVSTGSVTLTEPSAIVFNVDTTSSNCGLNNGSISINGVSGGTPPYTYLWNPSFSTTPILSNAVAGCYLAMITDSKGCVTDSVICINDIAAPVVNLFNSTNASCFGTCDGVVNISIATPISSSFPPTIQWSSVCNGTTAALPAFDNLLGASALCACDYTATVTDTAGCVGTYSYQVTEPTDLISFIPTSSNVSCFNGSNGTATVSALAGTVGSGYSYEWQPSLQTGITATGLMSGIYTVITTDANGCKDTSSVIIDEPTLLEATSSSINVSCNTACDGSISVVATGGKNPYNYSWSSTTQNSPTISNLCDGNYAVTVLDANACNLILNTTITQPLPLMASISMTASACSDANGTATVYNVTGGTSAYNYQWNSQPIQNTAIATTLVASSYTAMILDQNNCFLPLTIIVPDMAGPTITTLITTDVTCFGFANGTATVNTTGGTIPLNYVWDDFATQNNSAALNLSSGIYNVTVTDANGCTDLGVTVVSEPSALIAIPVGSGNLCFGETGTIWGAAKNGTPFTSVSAYNITWTDSTSWNGNQGPHLITPSAPGTYDFCFTITDSNGCSDNDCVSLVVSPKLKVETASEETMCLGSSASISASGFGGKGTESYCFHWDFGAVGCSLAADAQIVNPVDTTTYRVVLTDGCSVPDTSFITVNVAPLPVSVFVPVEDIGCPPFNAVFLGNSNMDNTTLCWDFNADGITDTCDVIPLAGSSSTQNWVYENSGIFDVILEVTSIDGCKSTSTLNEAITVYPKPDARFILSSAVVDLVNATITFDATSTTGANDLSWDFGDGSGGINVIEKNTYLDTGKYDVILTAFNSFGCLDTMLKIIEVKPDHTLFTPNAFTPNNDGINDYFFPKGVGVSDTGFEFVIYDRWGTQIFISTSINNQWNGTVRGSNTLAPTGVYVWKISAIDFDGKKIKNSKRIGQITLLR